MINYDSGPFPIPYSPLPISLMYDYAGRRALYTPEALAIVDTGKTPAARYSYAQMNDRATRLAHWLRQTAGVLPGDRVAILARDGVEHLDSFLACSKLGAIHTPLNWRLHPQEWIALLDQTLPCVVICDAMWQEAIAPWAEGGRMAKARPAVVVTTEVLADLPSAPPLSLDDLFVPDTLESTAALIFTGGTSGYPKAAQISHRMIGWNTLNTVIHDLRHEDIYLNVFPLFHTGGLFVYTLPNYILGGTTILMRQFEPAEVLRLIQQERATLFAGVPTMYQMLTQAPNWQAADLSSLRFCTSGGAPLPVSLVEQYAQEKGVRFKQGFGMTEFGPGLFALAAEDAVTQAGSIGRPNFYVMARIVDEANQPLGPDEVGELVLKGPSAASGYDNDPEATAAAVDAAGWFHTGDLAQRDAANYFRIVDRKKDMFISGGENVYPAEIEKALYQHPAVLMCAVVGIPDPRWGQVGLACVVLRPGQAATTEELLAHLRGRLARYKVPRRVEIMERLPISAAGKVLKRVLQEEMGRR